MTQEALHNVLKHAQSTQVSVLLQRRPGDVLLLVEDNGKGFDVAAVEQSRDARQRLGLVGIRERMVCVGGTLKIESAPGKGAAVFATAPMT